MTLHSVINSYCHYIMVRIGPMPLDRGMVVTFQTSKANHQMYFNSLILLYYYSIHSVNISLPIWAITHLLYNVINDLPCVKTDKFIAILTLLVFVTINIGSPAFRSCTFRSSSVSLPKTAIVLPTCVLLPFFNFYFQNFYLYFYS